MADTTAIQDILTERGSRYGSFDRHAEITQRLKAEMRETPNWEHLTHSQREALEMVAHKIGRILNGDPNYVDSWVDIVGYTQLVVNELVAMQAAASYQAYVAANACPAPDLTPAPLAPAYDPAVVTQ